MNDKAVILLAEDDDGHAKLIRKNLERAGLINPIVHLKDGQEVMDYLLCRGEGPKREKGFPLLLLLDIRMPKMDGIEVLRQIKNNDELRALPVIMLTTTDDPREIENCHLLGCSHYIVKPVAYGQFVETIRQMGLFLAIVEVPKINGELRFPLS